MNTLPTVEWLFSLPVVERLGWVLVHSLWQFALVVLLVGVMVRVMRRSSSTMRYGVLLVALAVSIAAPVATWMLMPSDVPVPLASRLDLDSEHHSIDALSSGADVGGLPSDAMLASDAGKEVPTPDAALVSDASKPRATVSSSTAFIIQHEPSWSERAKTVLRPWLAWIVMAWSLGVVVCSARPLLGWYTLRRLRHVGVSPVSDEVLAALHRVSERLGLRSAVRLLQSTLARLPIVVGYLRPVILLPVSVVTSIPTAQLEAILAHELAHVRRNDFIVNLLQTLVETFFFYHPAVWWLSRQIRVEREHCCDDLVVKLLGDRVEYGRALVAIEQLRGTSSVLALGATDGSLLSRVRRIVGFNYKNNDTSAVERWPAAVFGLALLGAILLLNLNWGFSARDEVQVRGEEREPIRVMLKLNRKEFLLGESIAVDYELTNDGAQQAPFGKGGFYPDLRINDGFRMSAVKVDENGKQIGEPVTTWPMPPNFGGPKGNFELRPGEKFSTTLVVTRYLKFLEPGRYRLRVENVDRLERKPKKAYSSGETYLTLKQPSPQEARRVFEQMKQAPRKAYDDNAMKFLPEAADFQAMHQPVYLPILKEFAAKSDRDAFESLERMERLGANEVLVATLAKALDRDDWRTARVCFQHLKKSLPFPNWFNKPLSEYDQPNRDRVARLWKADFGPTLARLAKRLNVEVTSLMRDRESKPLDADANEREFLKVFRNGYFPPEHPQSLLIDIDFIYRCVGRPEDFSDCLAAFAHSIALTKTLPLETNQYFRPRGSASGFGHTVIYMLRRGAKAPNQPAHPGEAAAFAIALRTQDSFRPAGWQAELMKWLKSDSPYLAEVILNHLPDPIPAEVLDYLPTALAHDYIDLQIAACHLAKKSPRPVYREPLQKILDNAKDEYLRKYAVDAARANGINAKYDGNAPFVDAEKENAAATAPPVGVRTLRKPELLFPDHWIVMSVGFDKDGKELVTASRQSFATIRRWDVVGKKLISEIKLEGDKHGREFREGTLMLSGDRRRVIAATDAYVGIWETATGKLLTKLPIPRVGDNDTVRILTCTPDFSVIVGSLETNYERLTLVYDAHTVVWDGTHGKMLRINTHKQQNHLIAITLSPDGKRFATTNGGGANIWETSTGERLVEVPNDNSGRKHSNPETSSLYTNHVWSIQFSPSGRQLAIGDILGVKLADAASGKLLQQLEGPYSYSSGQSRSNLVFSKDGQLLARMGTGDKTGGTRTGYVVPIWSTLTGQKLYELHTGSNDGAFSDDRQQFTVGFSDLQMALAVWRLCGNATDAERTEGPGPESRKDKVEENGHYHGKKAAEFIDTFKPTWGDAKLGVQYGIALTKPQRQFRIGERVPLVVFFRNASDQPLKLDMRPDFFGNTPKVLNARGAAVEFENVSLLGSIPHYVENLEPGEAVGPFYLNFGLGANPRPGKQNWHPYYKTPAVGKSKLTHSVSIDVVVLKDGAKSKRDQITSSMIEFEIIDGGTTEN